jgi:two-component system, NarL family, sensor histidine kinase DesK
VSFAADARGTGPAGDLSRRASVLAAAVLCLLFAVRVTDILGIHGPLTAAALFQLPFTVALFVLPVLFAFAGPRRVLERHRWTVLAVQAVLTWVPFAVFGGRWQVGVGGLLAGVVLVTVSGPVSWLVAAALLTADVTVRATVVGLPFTPSWYGVSWTVITFVDDTVVAFGMIRLAQLVGGLQEARGEAAGLAVAAERLKAATVLQSAVGERLAAIADAAADARQALPCHPGRARAQVTAAGTAAREAAAQARRLTTSRRDLPYPESSATSAGGAVIGARFAWAALAYGFLLPPLGALFTLVPFLAGSVLMLVPRRWRWAGYAAVVISWSVLFATVPLHGNGASPGVIRDLYEAAATAFGGLLVYGLSRLAEMAGELDAVRGEVARMAAVRERLRVARDVHDLLGLGLSAIALKADLVGMLIGRDDARAAAEIGELGRACAAARADIRLVTGDRQQLSLIGELPPARQILASAGVQVQVGVCAGPLSAGVDEVLAVVLREAVTNILRHAAATSCTIEASASGGAVRLAVSNDGVAGQAGPPGGNWPGPARGSGLANLATRVQTAGGRLASRPAGGQFELIAEIPLDRVPAGSP